MALSTTPARFAEIMDPHEILEWTIPCGPLLELGEQIDSFTLTLYAEATALGLTILGTSDGYPDPAKSNNDQDVTIWFKIDAAYRDNVGFDGTGSLLPMNIHIATNAVNPRERDRDFVLQVAQRGQ